jgi:hypothetical protein
VVPLASTAFLGLAGALALAAAVLALAAAVLARLKREMVLQQAPGLASAE